MNTLTLEVFNAREQDVSGDLMRAQSLASREVQNLLGDGSANDGGAPITAMSGVLSLAPIVSTFTMALGAAGAFFYDPSDPGLTPDDSAYKVVRWVAQNIAFSTPDGANPRIDLVIATPAMVGADPTTRNILTDPTTRTFAPQTVNKTINPKATITVLAGTPGSSPVPPTLPAQSVALAEVWVPAAVSDSTTFGVVPRIWRRAPFPASTLNTIVEGLRLSWDLSAAAGAASTMTTSGGFRHRILIDGELVDFQFSGSIAISQDAGANNPFAAAAPTTWNAPYYIYAVGGRNSPQNQPSNAGANIRSPLAIVESLVAPNNDGHPSSAITPPRGSPTTAGAVYIGLGFVVMNTTNRAACVMDDEMTYFGAINGFANQLNHTIVTGGTTPELVGTPGSKPSISGKAHVQVESATASGTTTMALYPDRGDGGGAAPQFTAGAFGGGFVMTKGATELAGKLSWPAGANGNVWVEGGAPGDGVIVYFTGYNHRVNRLASLR